MTGRKSSREVKIEATRLVTERGVAVAQACRDPDPAESVLRRWMREATAAPATAFPWQWPAARRAGRDCGPEERGRQAQGGA